MKSLGTILVALLSGFVSAQNQYVNNHLIIKLTAQSYNQSTIVLEKQQFGLSEIDQINNELSLVRLIPIGNSKVTKTFVLEFATEIAVEATALRYKQTGMLVYVEPDYLAQGSGVRGAADIVPNDTRFDRQWGFVNNGSMAGIGNVVADADVDIDLAWDIQTGDPNMVIAVPDSGLRMIHPDIAPRIWVNTGEIAGNGMDDDGNGFVDDVNGWDYVNNDNNPTDDLGHGTNVAGIIGAVANNNLLYTGANWNSKIMPLKVLNSSNSGSYANMASSIYYAVDEGAKIISMSIGGNSNAQVMADALSYANQYDVLFLACMMNFDNNVTYFPAGYSLDFPNVIAVGSTNPDDTRTFPFFWNQDSGSNYGSHLNVVAPGNYIYGLDAFSNTNANSYWGGTSQATPLVAGIASLVWAQNPDLTPQDVRSILESTAEDQVGDPGEDVAGFDLYMGHGRVNALAALQTLTAPETDTRQEMSVENPVDGDALTIFCQGNHSGSYQFLVHDMQGKLIGANSIVMQAGLNQIDFPYASGSYIATLKSDGYTRIFKILKK